MTSKKTNKADEKKVQKSAGADNKKVESIAETKVESNGKSAEAPKDTEKVSGAAASNFPMFYDTVVPLNVGSHADLKIAPMKDYSFAKSANSIILAATEFAQAAVHYPVVFSKIGENLQAFAVTGHTAGENLFVGKDKKWRADTYIPAYVRRYPFLLVQSDDKNLSLGMDEKSSLFGQTGGEALYEKGEASNVAKHALAFCYNYRQELERTVALLKQINDADILIERSADVSMDGGKKKAKITGFSIVDEKKLSELPDDKFLELRKSGALNLIYSHLWSMRAWNNLLDDK